MQKNRIIFYVIFGVYQLITFVFTLIIDENTSFLFESARFVPLFKYLSSIGLLLITIDFIWTWRQHRKFKAREEEYRLENNTLKARIYDEQQQKNQNQQEKQ